MNAGALKWRMHLLELGETAPDVYEWQPASKLQARIEHQNAGAIFAKQGIMARSVKITMRRRQGITLHNALELADDSKKHYFMTDINYDPPGFYTVTAAIIEPVKCIVERTKTGKGENNRPVVEELPPLVFPGYLTEKYLRQTQEAPMSYSETRYVLVTPKPMEIQTGELVKINGIPYESVIPHMLDPYRNEYEILRRQDN